jgi:hypothetical protein
MPTTKAQLQATQRWKEANREKYRAMTLKYVNESNNRWKSYKNEVKRLSKIMFDGYVTIN